MKKLTPAQQRIVNVVNEITIGSTSYSYSYKIGDRYMTGPEKQTIKRLLNDGVLRKVDVTSAERKRDNELAPYYDGCRCEKYRVVMG